jgi:FkbM family methyltransferase
VTGTQPLLDRVLGDVDAALGRRELEDNVDPERFPHGMAAVSPEQTRQRRRHLVDQAERWQWLAGQLDAAGTALLEALLRFHLVGHRHARVGPSAAQVRALLAEADARLITARDVTAIPYAGSQATHCFDLRPLGYDITLESYMLGVQGTFQLQQYASPTHSEARPGPGETAIDAGGCFGETALWLAHHVGAHGRVQTLEFAPANLAILQANLERNPQLAQRVELTPAALWERRLSSIGTDRGGPASMVTTAPSTAVTVPAISLDELIIEAGLDRVDFVKLDIEGAEPAALRGGRRTLERWRPKLALAVYHDIDHLWQLPLAISELGCGYRFALGHFTMHAEETVIYAWVR